MKSPLVTVGMPVYNGAATIDGAVRSLLAQTLTDMELVVSDNASTDDTRDIVERLAREDSRIRYIRHAANIGANGNYSAVARAARGTYLKWASASDLCAPTFLSRCVEVLEADSDAVLAAPRTRLFELDPSNARDYDQDFALLDASPVRRFQEWMRLCRLNNAFNGVIRLEALRRTEFVGAYVHADLVLMGHLALLGKFLLVEDYLYLRRMEVGTSTALMDEGGQLRHHYPERSRRILWQNWKRQRGWVSAAFAAPMTILERMRMTAILARQGLYYGSALGNDVLDAMRYVAHRPK